MLRILNIEDLMLNSRDISRFIINTKKSLDEIGAMIVKEAIETSYEKSGKRASSNVQVTKQTVMNTIRKLGEVENDEAKLPTKKKQVKTIYIEADEDHVALQNGKNKEIKLIYVHEGKKYKSKGRYELINE